MKGQRDCVAYVRPVLTRDKSWDLVTGNGLPSGGRVCYKKDGVTYCNGAPP